MTRATIYTIAKKASVSVNTVSRALNNKPDINVNTRKRILKIAKELNYVPNLLAKSLKSGNTKIIGVVISNLYNPFFSEVLCGINDELDKQGYSMIICNSDSNSDKEEKNINTLLEQRVNGLMVTPVREKSLNIENLQKTKLPLVLFMSHLKKISNDYDYVGFNDKKGSYEAIKYLISKGHKKILYLKGPQNFSLTNERLWGVKNALKTYGLGIDTKLFIEIKNPNINEGYMAVKEALRNKINFTAISTFNDYIAMGSVKAVLEEHLKIPKDIAIVGYDDIEFAPLSIIPLTTIQLSKYLLGKNAAKLILEKITNPNKKNKKIFLEPKLIIRQSG